MQVKIRKPVTIDVTQADDRTSFTLHFVTEGEHEVSVAVPREMLGGLLAELQAAAADTGGEPANDDRNDDQYEHRLLAALAAGSTRAA